MIPEKNNIWFYHGHRRLQPIPYEYIKPGLHFLKGLQPPKEKVYEKKIIVEEKHTRKASELF